MMKKPTKRVRSEVCWVAYDPRDYGFVLWAHGDTKAAVERLMRLMPFASKWRAVRVRITPLAGRGRK